MEARESAKDVAALFRKAGLRDSGTYREFTNRLIPAAEGSQSHSSLLLAPAEDAVASVSNEGARFASYQERSTQSLDRLLSEIPPKSKIDTSSTSTSIAFFSLAGGVGKTMLASTLARILSDRNHRVVLANFAGSFAMRHLCGENSQTVGPFTLLHPSQGEGHLPLTLIEAGETPGEQDQDHSLKLVQSASRGADATMLDFQPGASKFNLDRLRMANHILIPVLPDIHSALTLQTVEAFLRSRYGTDVDVHYILNRYEAGRPAHREMRDRFQTMLGNALAPFSISEDPQIQDAMRSGMTIMDYAPHQEVVGDLKALGEWAENMLVRPMMTKGMNA